MLYYYVSGLGYTNPNRLTPLPCNGDRPNDIIIQQRDQRQFLLCILDLFDMSSKFVFSKVYDEVHQTSERHLLGFVHLEFGALTRLDLGVRWKSC